MQVRSGPIRWTDRQSGPIRWMDGWTVRSGPMDGRTDGRTDTSRQKSPRSRRGALGPGGKPLVHSDRYVPAKKRKITVEMAIRTDVLRNIHVRVFRRRQMKRIDAFEKKRLGHICALKMIPLKWGAIFQKGNLGNRSVDVK